MDADRTLRWSFTAPHSSLVTADEIAGFQQSQGGGVSGGFAFINRSYRPKFVELHFLQLSECTCKHVEPYFANGRYKIVAE